MGRIQRLMGDMAFRAAPMMMQICLIMQTAAVQAFRLLSVTPNSLVVDGPWLGANGRDERGIAKHSLGQLRGTGRCDFSVLAEETLDRLFGLKVTEKCWSSVNAIFTVLPDSFPNVVDAANSQVKYYNLARFFTT